MDVKIDDILLFYGCPCEVAGTRDLSMFTDFFLNPVNGTTIKKLQSRVADFALLIGKACQIVVDNGALILRVQTGKQPTLDFFSYRCNLEKTGGNIALGLDAGGCFVSSDLFKVPHLLVSGATGSGKSVFLHNAVVSIATQGAACFRLIDLKRVELSIYNGCPFMVSDCITDAESAKNALLFEVSEMESRYKLMEKYHVRHYTELPQNKALLARVIVIDELADLMLNRDTRKSVENSIVRIAQLGRAAGCHLILATQRPSREVITGLIKANIPARLAFRTASAVDSRVIGINGAELLRGRGDCLYSGIETESPQRLQSFYISDSQLSQFVGLVKQKKSNEKRGFLRRLFF